MRSYITFWEYSAIITQDPAFGPFSLRVSCVAKDEETVVELLTALINLNTDLNAGTIYNLPNPTVFTQDTVRYYLEMSRDLVIGFMSASGILSDCIYDAERAAGQTVITVPNALSDFGLDLATLKEFIVDESPRDTWTHGN